MLSSLEESFLRKSFFPSFWQMIFTEFQNTRVFPIGENYSIEILEIFSYLDLPDFKLPSVHTSLSAIYIYMFHKKLIFWKFISLKENGKTKTEKKSEKWKVPREKVIRNKKSFALELLLISSCYSITVILEILNI